MSVTVQTLIWECSLYRGNTLLTLLALGDYCNDAGYCWPKVETLATKTRQSVRNVQYALRQFQRDGIVFVEINPGRSQKSYFHLNVKKLRLLQAEKVQTARAKGANSVGKRRKSERSNKEEPSVNPSLIHQEEGRSITFRENASRPFSNEDFIARDQRLMGEGYRQLERKNSMGVPLGANMSDKEQFEYACRFAGISIKRGLDIERERNLWPESNIVEPKKSVQGVAI